MTAGGAETTQRQQVDGLPYRAHQELRSAIAAPGQRRVGRCLPPHALSGLPSRGHTCVARSAAPGDAYRTSRSQALRTTPSTSGRNRPDRPNGVMNAESS